MKLKSIYGYSLIFCSIAFFSIKNTWAQQRPVSSQYIFDELLLNPAYAGSHVQLSATMTHRNQWVNLAGAPVTNTFSTHVGVMDNKVGLGLYIIDDKVGIHQELSIYGSYAYKIRFHSGVLSMGLQAGFNSRDSEFEKLNLKTLNDPYFIGNTSMLKPNFGTGLYFSRHNLYVGFSVPFILNNELFEETDGLIQKVRETRNYYLTSGFIIPLNRNETVRLRPSFLIRAQEGSPLNFDITANVIFHDVISVGNSYRNIEGIVSFINVKLLDNLYLGYGYDWTQSDLNKFSNGTHEFILNYRIRINGVHQPVECPSYFSIR